MPWGKTSASAPLALRIYSGADRLRKGVRIKGVREGVRKGVREGGHKGGR